MYASLILAYFGEGAILIQFWSFAVLPFVIMYVNRIVIPLEELRLKETFGTEYVKIFCQSTTLAVKSRKNIFIIGTPGKVSFNEQLLF